MKFNSAREKKTYLNEIYNKYNSALFYYSCKKGLAQDEAEEIVQSTWLTAINAIDNFRGDSHIKTFLHGILVNKMREFWRHKHKMSKYFTFFEVETDLTDYYDESGKSCPQRKAEVNEMLGITSNILNELPTSQSDALLKKSIGFSGTEVSLSMGISENNFRVLSFRAREKTKIQLKKRYPEYAAL